MKDLIPAIEPKEPSLAMDEKIRIDVLAKRIKLLFGFCNDLIPDIDLLERTGKLADKMVRDTHSASVILMAAGLDYDEAALESGIKSRRTDALVNFLKVLRDTESERKEFSETNAKRAIMQEQLKQQFGL